MGLFAWVHLHAFLGWSRIGPLELGRISHIPIKPNEFHALISRTPAGGEKLLKAINDGIAALKADRSYDEIFKKYGL